MGEVSRAASLAATLLVRFRWAVLAGVVLSAVASVVIMSRTPMYFDTGIDAMYARRTHVSDRQNLFVLFDGTRLLPNRAAVPPAAAEAFAASYGRVADTTSAVALGSRSFGVTATDNGHQEIHVLLRATGGWGTSTDVLSQDHVLVACDLQHRTAAAMAEQGVCIREPGTGACVPPFSILSFGPVAAAHPTFAPIFAKLRALAHHPKLESTMALMTSVCASASAGVLLCKQFPGHCAPAGCAAAVKECRVAGLDPCAVISRVRPTATEVRAVGGVPATELGARGCTPATFDWDGLRATVDALVVLRRWSRADPSLQVLGLPVDVLLDMSFGDGGSRSSNVTRLVFGLPSGRAGLGEGDRAVDFTFWAVDKVFSRVRARGLEVAWRQWDYYKAYANRAIVHSLFWALLAVAFLAIYSWPHIGSLTITLTAVFGILSSFPLALVVYRCWLGITWMGVLHFLGIFVILGIGADDVFVVMEHWKHSQVKVLPATPGHRPSGTTLEQRLAWTLYHSFAAVSATSLTTVAAFASNLICTMTPVRLFGLFMMLLALINYAVVLTLLPALLAIREAAAAAKRSRGDGFQALDQGDVADSVVPEARDDHGLLPEGCVIICSESPGAHWATHTRRTLSPIPEAGSAGGPFLDAPPQPVTPRARLAPRGALSESGGAGEPAPLPSSNGWGWTGRTMSEQGGLGFGSPGPPRFASHSRRQSSEANSAEKSELSVEEGPGGGAQGARRDAFSHDGDDDCAGSVHGDGDDWLCGRRLACGPAEIKRAHGRCVEFTCAGSKYGAVHVFFECTLSGFVTRHSEAICLAALLVVAAFGVLASLLQLPRGRPSVWPKDHNINKYFQMEERFGFGQQLSQVGVQVVWGVLPRDSGSLNNVFERGEVVLDPAFDATAPGAQLWLRRFCELLAGRHDVVPGSVRCPMADISDYLSTATGQQLPLPATDMERYLQLYSTLPASQGTYNAIKFGSDRLVESGVVFDSHTRWLHPDLDPRSYGEPTYDDTHPFRGWTLASGAGHGYRQPHASFSGNMTRPVTYKVEYTLTRLWSVPYVQLREVWRREEGWMAERLRTAPLGLRRGFQTSAAWAILEMQETLFNSSRQALLLSLALALVTLLAMTGNAAIAGMATLSIACVVVLFAGSMYLMGWSLGIVECICITILVGLSVDYIVHVATAYCHAPAGAVARADRLSFALGTVGLSVVSGAATTVGAAAFLFPCEMAVFGKFGTFICITLLASLVFALLVFPAMCAAVGPVHGQGSVGVLLRGDVRAFCGLGAPPPQYSSLDGLDDSSGHRTPTEESHEQELELQGHASPAKAGVCPVEGEC